MSLALQNDPALTEEWGGALLSLEVRYYQPP